MNYAIMIGSNMFIGKNGFLKVEVNGKLKEFFRVREVFNERSFESHLAVDCDIKDSDNNREVKLFKNKPVASNESIDIQFGKTFVFANREDGSPIIKVEQLDSTDSTLPKDGPIVEYLKTNTVDIILRITGDFHAGQHRLIVDNETCKIGPVTLSGNLSHETNGIILTAMGFMM